jgi:hypothetical protein
MGNIKIEVMAKATVRAAISFSNRKTKATFGWLLFFVHGQSYCVIKLFIYSRLTKPSFFSYRFTQAFKKRQ